MVLLPVSNTVRVPPTPEFIVMIDRDDGTEWVLSYDSTGTWIAINDQGLQKGGDLGTAEWTDARVFGPYEGPYLPVPPHLDPRYKLRLLIRGGYLGFEFVENTDPKIGFISQARILTRRGRSSTMHELLIPAVYRYFDPAPLEYIFDEAQSTLAYEEQE